MYFAPEDPPKLSGTDIAHIAAVKLLEIGGDFARFCHLGDVVDFMMKLHSAASRYLKGPSEE